MSSGSIKNVIYKMCLEIIYLIYMYKKIWHLKNLQWLICHQTKPCVCMCVCVYIYIYIYSHPQTDCFIVSPLFSVARHVGYIYSLKLCKDFYLSPPVHSQILLLR